MMNLSEPIQLCNVIGTEFQTPNSTSWLNEEDVEYCADLVVRLYKIEPDQIGVITPYKSRAKFIRQKLAKMLTRRRMRDLLEERYERKLLVPKK
jgi:superfamily I DNA and/or RNA helicase